MLNIPLGIKRKMLEWLWHVIRMDQTREAKNNLKVSQKVEDKWADPDVDGWEMKKMTYESWRLKTNGREEWFINSFLVSHSKRLKAKHYIFFEVGEKGHLHTL